MSKIGYNSYRRVEKRNHVIVCSVPPHRRRNEEHEMMIGLSSRSNNACQLLVGKCHELCRDHPTAVLREQLSPTQHGLEGPR